MRLTHWLNYETGRPRVRSYRSVRTQPPKADTYSARTEKFVHFLEVARTTTKFVLARTFHTSSQPRPADPQNYPFLYINHAHFKLTNHTIVLGHDTRTKFGPDDVSRTSCENSRTRAARTKLRHFLAAMGERTHFSVLAEYVSAFTVGRVNTCQINTIRLIIFIPSSCVNHRCFTAPPIRQR